MAAENANAPLRVVIHCITGAHVGFCIVHYLVYCGGMKLALYFKQVFHLQVYRRRYIKSVKMYQINFDLSILGAILEVAAAMTT